MNENVPDTLTVLPDPGLFRAARWMQRICLGVAGIAILLGLMPLAGISLVGTSPATARTCLPFLLTALLCALSLFLSGPDRTGVAFSYACRTANFFAICALIAFWILSQRAAASPPYIAFPPERFGLGLCALTIVVVLLDQKNWLINQLVDVLASGLCLLSLLLISDAVFGRFALFRAAGNPGLASLTICLVALTIVVTLRQAEHGVFSIFLGVGIGSRLARVFAPILMLLPFAWEAVNEWMNRADSTGHMGAAMLASASVAVAVSILLFFAWRISRMENEIHDLVLRDEATRLYNIRGFHMLAEHALRLAQRSGVPFSVLFVDLENLAQIHAQLGPDASARALAEAGEILRATFRESDIKGRIGADEFAVAGRFDRAGISVAALRLEAATAARGAKSGRPIPLKFSMGHVTTAGGDSPESLKDMLYRAGQTRNRQEGLLKETLVN